VQKINELFSLGRAVRGACAVAAVLGLGAVPTVSAQDSGQPKTIFEETFEDTTYTSRGWYDYSEQFQTSSAQHAENSQHSCWFHWASSGDQLPVQKGARAHMDPVEGLTLTFHIKFSDNWTWTGVGWHPHFIMFTTSEDDDYIGPAYTHLTLYVEPVDGKLVFGEQDGLNIDLTHLNQNLVGLSENRAVAGGNGDPDGYGGNAYLLGNVTTNTKQIGTDSLCFREETGPFYKADWHTIKAHIQLNSIIDGKGVANGVVQYWYDGKLVQDHHDLMLRTGRHPNMKLNHFLLLPYFGPGVPHEQSIWIDDIQIIQDEQTLPAVDPPAYNPTLIDEKFEDTGFDSRGWYDSPEIALDALTYGQGQGHSALFTWAAAGDNSPTHHGGRIQFDPVEGFTVSCYVRFSDDWSWPADTTQPQSLFWFTTSEDDKFTNPLNTFLTTQVNTANGQLNFLLSDYRNIDQLRLGQDLSGVTESRAVCGGNGDSDPYGGAYAVVTGGVQNSKKISSRGRYFTDTPGAYLKSDWHQIKAHAQLNSIVNGKGVANGVVQCWFDGKLVLEHYDVMFRTAQHADMKFNQLMLLPYNGASGVAHAQSLWLDDLLIVKDEQTLRIPAAKNLDVNGDGRVSLLDAVAFLLKGIRTPDAPELDINNDGAYRMDDLIEMLREVVKAK